MNIVLGLGSIGITVRWRPYSARAPAAAPYRRGISYRHRIAGTVRRHMTHLSRILVPQAKGSEAERAQGRGGCVGVPNV